MINNLSDLLSFAKSRLNRRNYQMFLANNPSDHDRIYHELGLLGHLIQVYRAAVKIFEETGFDCRTAALYHDLAKIGMFPTAVSRTDRGLEPGIVYKGHEKLSAALASRDGLSVSECAAIAIHDWAYYANTPAQIVQYFREKNAEYGQGQHAHSVLVWIALCACDAYGKGWTDKQSEQRPLLPPKFCEVFTLENGLANYSNAIQVMRVAEQIALSTEPFEWECFENELAEEGQLAA